jgi:PucR C-terminal helix-turn-helix domain/GGDEF-like domain
MAVTVEEAAKIVGSGLEQLWTSPTTRTRRISCITYATGIDDLTDRRAAELIIVDAGLETDALARALLEFDAGPPAAMLLLPGSALAGDKERIHELALAGPTSVGVLGPQSKPHAVANALARSLATTRDEPTATELRTAETLQSLAETLGRLIGNSVTIETPGHELLASSPTGSDVDQDRIETILHRRAAAKIMDHPDFKRFLAQMRGSDWPVHFPARPEFAFSGRVAMRVVAEGEMLGVIWATDTARPLGEGDYAIMRQAADVAGGIFLREQLGARREAMLRAELLDEVINGRIRDPENIRTIGLSVGWNVDRPQQALIVAIDDFEGFRLHNSRSGAARFRRVHDRLLAVIKLDALGVDSEAVIGMRSSSVVVLLNVGDHADIDAKTTVLRVAESIVKRTTAFLPELSVTVGVGREFPSLEGLAESFRQAKLAAELGQSLWGGNRAVHYDDLGIHRVLSSLSEHEGMITPALQRIVDYDRDHATEYLSTMRAYLRHMGRLRPASEELNIHRNTLEYRLARITEVTGITLDDPDSRLALELGIRVLELHRRHDARQNSES